ncbi:MAG: hypothetical protein A3C90_02395 [Candidatus Magasanikbacteria bacterium RIFCSPHIGHO2_02_FULL_51_14]|uniref:Uncharacterized protein n=1 Tax=Candidatus Magasanikbacteria bacterium RIFCSPHIGHO2_02_FULL_51_14 TaxID=1798683 RepID=A0A1F6MQJ3_9BACT|nr:MAG: hypothetical protein A3C90_02395 [Candidatus Magasanikbacteria bacterium RIFCSPHIGHO2_02_FULL_51_14]
MLSDFVLPLGPGATGAILSFLAQEQEILHIVRQLADCILSAAVLIFLFLFFWYTMLVWKDRHHRILPSSK